MKSAALMESLDQSAPPAGLGRAGQALWHIARGGWRMGPDWQAAHALCQGAEGERDCDAVHALCHLIEGDGFNSDYWYRRAGLTRRHDDPAAEWTVLADLIDG